jgi:predicted O-linked N-acetylglucosamine transferase (SPINDLY family)
MTHLLDADFADTLLADSALADLPPAAPLAVPPAPDMDAIRTRLRHTSFAQLIGVIESAGPELGEPATIALYTGWIAAQPPDAPQLYAAWFNLGVAFSRAHNPASAVIAYRHALTLRPDFHSAAVNLGTVLESQGQTEAALQTWATALQPDAARIMLFNNRARLLEQMGRLEEAEAEMRRSLLADPQQPDVIQHWVHVRQKMCQWPALSSEIPGLTRDDLLRHAGPLSALALSDDIAFQCATARDWIERKTTPVGPRLSPPEGYRHQRIRLGYLSSDFCRHAMSYLIAELFENHDRDRFEVFGYCSSPDDGSEIRTRVIRAFDRFRSVRELPDRQAAQLIRDDEIDILIDLNGLTSGARPQILRWKPAPVQATYLGFVGPVPLPELDYMFCDHIVVPPEQAAAYQPAPLYIAQNYQANDTRRTIGPSTTRAAAGLPDDRFVFCCFSNHYKTTEEIFDAWMAILHRTTDTILWLVGDNASARRNMLARARQRGIDGDRLVFAGRVGPDDYMARLRLPDLFLDTFPYNAGTIASDAIRMGLPLVTLSGQSFASRMAGRLLTAAGAQQGIATSLDAYVDIAVRLANDRAAYEAYKGCFGLQSWGQAIGDMARFTIEFESALTGMRILQGENP